MVLLDIYEHGGMAYSVTGTGMQCRWDTTRGGAIWVPDDGAQENIRYNVLRGLGIGDVKWFGACGSHDDPLHARYLFKKAVKEAFPKHRILEVKDPLHANVRGFQIAGMNHVDKLFSGGRVAAQGGA